MAAQPRHRRDRPIESVGAPEDLLHLVRLISGDTGATMEHQLAGRITNLAEAARRQEVAARQSVSVKPALKQIDDAIDQLQRLGRTLNDLPEDLGILLADELRISSWQDDALPRLAGALEVIRGRVGAAVGAAADGSVPRGPGRLADRLHGDVVDFVVQQIAQMLADARGADAISGDISGALYEAVSDFWAYAMGHDGLPNLTRKVQREAEPARLDHRARELDRAADEIVRAAMKDPSARDAGKNAELREEAFRLREQAHALRIAHDKKVRGVSA